MDEISAKDCIKFAMRGDHKTRQVWIHRHDPDLPVGRRIFKVDKAVELDPKPSQDLINHSPDGFAWGYEGSGPSQLALAVLLYVTGDAAISQRYYQDFKRLVIAPLNMDEHFILDCVWLPIFISKKLKSKKGTKHGN